MDSVSNKNSLVFICWSGIQRKACICLVCSLSHTPARGFPVLYSSMFGISMDLRGFQEPVLRTNKVTSVGLRRAGTFFQNWKSLLTSPSPNSAEVGCGKVLPKPGNPLGFASGALKKTLKT